MQLTKQGYTVDLTSWRPSPDSASKAGYNECTDAASLFDKIKGIQPDISVLAALGVGDGYDAFLKELGAAATAAGVKLAVKKVNKISDLVGALRSIKDTAQGFWVPPDTTLMNQDAFK